MKASSKEAIVCIGANCGDRTGNVAMALVWASCILEDFRHSPIYATPDCHGGQRAYLNAVCSGTTELTPAELETLFKNYECKMGRTAAARAKGEVPLDVDLVVYDGEVLRNKDYASEYFLLGYRGIVHA